ncbi:hypothetical protein PR048_009161 [Dryococelus australis]|uniref:Uncharacterized protein n=1 Tax=Dryococelus australis TaxID=614101 RepID=A0ABQ9I068_9NEOP|nr:hypothetical protein PR048_009161 [Dryococelus australis]
MSDRLSPSGRVAMNIPLRLALLLAIGWRVEARDLKFPNGFMMGASSAAYQVEGAWNTNGKGESIWDRLVHTQPSCIAQSQTGDVACDSYHKYKEDVKALKAIGFGYYRFSISWPRVLPTGDIANVNQDGVNYYNNLINELLANNIQPVVTMYHWDLPQHLQEFGGMSNNVFADYFEDYAYFLFSKFGDRVKWWITFNEPLSLVSGYMGDCFPPRVNSRRVGEYYVAHNLLMAHARAYHIYDKLFRTKQKGKIGISLNTEYAKPKSNSAADLEAVNRFLQFDLGWFAHPIFSSKGGYPPLMIERIANLSKAEGLRRSRLPNFSQAWIDLIKGSADFFGINMYTSKVVGAMQVTGLDDSSDMGHLTAEFDSSWPTSSVTWLRYTPFGMRGLLNWIHNEYGGNVPILVTENGWADSGNKTDTMRIRYYANYLASLLDAIYIDKIKVIGYVAWSITDNFEWSSGYT